MENRIGGGVILYIHNLLHAISLKTETIANVDTVFIEIESKYCITMIGLICRPPVWCQKVSSYHQLSPFCLQTKRGQAVYDTVTSRPSIIMSCPSKIFYYYSVLQEKCD